MPKIIGTTLADHRELTRRRLFNALGALLAEEPFDAITMSRIAQKAGVGRTAVRNHWPSLCSGCARRLCRPVGSVRGGLGSPAWGALMCRPVGSVRGGLGSLAWGALMGGAAPVDCAVRSGP